MGIVIRRMELSCKTDTFLCFLLTRSRDLTQILAILISIGSLAFFDFPDSIEIDYDTTIV
jgi:hypothetical protein